LSTTNSTLTGKQTKTCPNATLFTTNPA
jgi:hypothetical protein